MSVRGCECARGLCEGMQECGGGMSMRKRVCEGVSREREELLRLGHGS